MEARHLVIALQVILSIILDVQSYDRQQDEDHNSNNMRYNMEGSLSTSGCISWNNMQYEYMPPPEMISEPTLQDPRIVQSKTIYSQELQKDIVVSKFAMTCTVNYPRPPSDDGARFLVTFLFDGEELPDVEYGVRLNSFVANSTDLDVMLDEVYLRGRLGKMVSCNVSAYWESTPDDMSLSRSSNGYWAGIKTTTNPVYVYGNQSQVSLPMQLTVPITCWHCAEGYNDDTGMGPGAWFCLEVCSYVFRVDSSPDNSEVPCSYVTTDASFPIRVPTVLDSVGNELKEVRYVPYALNVMFDDYPPLWTGYQIPSIQVIVVDAGHTHRCITYGDPTYITFDNGNFDNDFEDDFLLVRSTKASSRVMEVQVRQRARSLGLVYNCGIAVREGNSALMIDMCQSGEDPKVTRLLQRLPTDFSTITTDPAGQIFSINMPSGLTVSIDSGGARMIIVDLPEEFGFVEGLCGNKNRLAADDVYDEKYRLNATDSMFQTQPQCLPGQSDVTVCQCSDLTGEPMVDCTVTSLNLHTITEDTAWKQDNTTYCSETSSLANFEYT